MTTLPESSEGLFPNLRLIVTGGDVFYRQDLEEWRRHFPSHILLDNVYGSTEAGFALIQRYDRETDISAPIPPFGSLIPDLDVLLLDDAGQVVGPGEVGELAIKSRYLVRGYWHKPEATDAAFQHDFVDPKARIYHTGDMGRWLPDGRL